MSKTLLGFFCLLASLSSAVSAAEWWWVTSSGDKPNRRVGFIDKSSLVTDFAGRISAWDFSVEESPQKDGVRKEKALHRYDCKKRTRTLLSLVRYGNNSRLISSDNWTTYEQSEEPIVPDSVGESKWTFVCQGSSDSDTPLKTSPEEFAAFYFKLED